ncbi:fatty-acid oxidation protein subunit alpha [Mergibacter septicus]|uniref:3-hydroxyacyl-CoA dehydrogenase NAD-binding domain-containing protein n=1 Tax=Mergibacter septicus TaxID=221402 RepID=UPI001C74EFCE|nr:3-hydroxyacyl-CoA dehydrogenase NAD-binding domain-containing protein [Mergibacter septicus]QDJ12506.1 fatty-acid oxidation protein subunit alpha [Mergibacter septicus]
MEQKEYIENEQVKLQVDQHNIAFITIDVVGKKNNILDFNFIQQLDRIIDEVVQLPVQALIFRSAKAENFIQGFDLLALEQQDLTQLAVMIEQAQQLMLKIKRLSIPTLAAIHGHCFGLGLELALACDIRVATLSPMTKFAMPQVRSGLLPFAGGTFMLPQTVGLKNALPLLLTGKKIDAKMAKQINLVDDVVPESLLQQTAIQYIQKSANLAKPFFKITKGLEKVRVFFEQNSFTRRQLLTVAESKEWLGPSTNYPAITSLIQVLEQTSMAPAIKAEKQAFLTLFESDNSKVLRQLERTKRLMRSQYAARSQVRDVKCLAVIGGGFMGAGIAYITAHRAGIPVRIKNIHPDGICNALHLSYHLLQKEVTKGQLTLGQMQQKMYLISGGERFTNTTKADFVIEAVDEDLALKQKVLQESEALYRPDTIFASNTSTLSIADIASVATRPENVIGFHYFSPITQRKILEIIPHSHTSEKTIATAIHFANQQGKIPLLVADKPGFFVNRILIPYLLEAIYCLQEGETVEFIDRALQEFGFSIGPLAMLDDFGLDLIAKTAPTLEQHYGVRFKLPAKIVDLILDNRKGRKNHRGFYLYNSKTDERTMVDKSIYHTMKTIAENNLEAEQIVRRCILMMLNEAAYCLQDGVIRHTDEGNMASVLGVFFPEFRGGIYAYMQHIGAISIVNALNQHVKFYGERFQPCQWLLDQAEQERQQHRL